MNPRVYLIDDDPDVLAVTRWALDRDGGFQVLAFRRPHDAWARAREAPPAVVVVDLIMPEMDGVEALHHVRNTNWGKDTAVILMSAQARHDEPCYRALGFAAVLGKPFDPLVLPGIVRSVLP
jgi:CheY-like chemotaxis protein